VPQEAKIKYTTFERIIQSIIILRTCHTVLGGGDDFHGLLPRDMAPGELRGPMAGETVAWNAGREAVKNQMLVITFSNDGREIERATLQTGKCAVKVALLMLAKRDGLRPSDMLRVEAGHSDLKNPEFKFEFRVNPDNP